MTIADDFPEQRFLLADDSPDHLDLMQRYLSSMGLTFATARDGREAMALLAAEPFDIVISDIMMPKIDGMELLRLVKEGYPTTDVILMTGYGKTYSLTDVIGAGATDYLEKPFTRDVVRAKILRILRERRLAAELKAEVRQRREIGAALEKKSGALERRGRALNCLYRITTLMEATSDVPKVLAGTVDLLPSAFALPAGVAVRLGHGGQTYETPGFSPSSQGLSAVIRAKGDTVGQLEVSLPASAETEAGRSMWEEERALLAEVAERLSHFIDRRQAECALHDYSATLEERVRQRTKDYHTAQAALEAVFQSIPDAIVAVDGAMVVTYRNEPCRNFLQVTVGKPFLHAGGLFQNDCAHLLQRTLRTHEAVVDYRLEITGEEGKAAQQVVLISTSAVQDTTGDMVGALLVVHDITRITQLEAQLGERRRFRAMIGKGLQMREVYELVRKLAGVDSTVLVTGESGTGKELLVETLHASGNRAARPLIRVNCAALPENLLESELFGHVRGAFTGATKDRAGRIQAAEGGILFLDEIGDISPRIQLKLLRFFETREYERVGESRTRKADVRILAATNADLAARVRAGVFREDLYYRLKVMVIHLPPLRERMEDIPLLIEHFLALYGRKFQRTFSGLAPQVFQVFMNHPWPGNVRELRHVIEHACLLCPGQELRLEHLPKDLLAAKGTVGPDRQAARFLTREAIAEALRQAGGNKVRAARLLGVSRATLYNKIKALSPDPAGG